jgi:hypothetical protein
MNAEWRDDWAMIVSFVDGGLPDVGRDEAEAICAAVKRIGVLLERADAMMHPQEPPINPELSKIMEQYIKIEEELY